MSTTSFMSPAHRLSGAVRSEPRRSAAPVSPVAARAFPPESTVAAGLPETFWPRQRCLDRTTATALAAPIEPGGPPHITLPARFDPPAARWPGRDSPAPDGLALDADGVPADFEFDRFFQWIGDDSASVRSIVLRDGMPVHLARLGLAILGMAALAGLIGVAFVQALLVLPALVAAVTN